MLDEPMNGLDPAGMREICTLLRRLSDGGVTVFVWSHLLDELPVVLMVAGAACCFALRVVRDWKTWNLPTTP